MLRVEALVQFRLELSSMIMRRIHRVGLVSLAFSLALGIRAAYADVVVVVSADSSIASLSKSQIIDIFLGKRTRFPDGGNAVPIDQNEGSVARDEFYLKFASMAPAQVRAFWSKIIFTGRGQPPRIAGTVPELKKLLLTSPNAIGYLDQSMVDSSLKVVLAP
jgi:ABC-type phosphate transport system substrate-binding protein